MKKLFVCKMVGIFTILALLLSISFTPEIVQAGTPDDHTPGTRFTDITRADKRVAPLMVLTPAIVCGILKVIREGSLKGFLEGFGEGALGGFVAYAGERISREDNVLLTYTGLILGDAGTSIIGNSLIDKGIFSRYRGKIGPLRFEIDKNEGFQYGLDLITTVRIINAVSEGDKFLLEESLKSGMPVFLSDKINENLGPSDPDRGWFEYGIVRLNNEFYPDSVEDKILSHYRVHRSQYNIISLLSEDLLERQIYNEYVKLPKWAPRAYFTGWGIFNLTVKVSENWYSKDSERWNILEAWALDHEEK